MKWRGVEPDSVAVASEMWKSKTKYGQVPKIKHAAAVKVQLLRVSIGGRGVPGNVLLQ